MKRIAYLTSEYPAPSHTFIRREVDALRMRGIEIETFSIRRPQPGVSFSPPDQKALKTTTYLLPIGLRVLIGSHLKTLIRSPSAYFKTLLKSLGHRAPGVRSLLWSIFYFAEAVVIAEMFKKMGIKHIHNHFANASGNVGMLASYLLGIPWSLTLHGTADWDYPFGYILPEKINQAAFVACVSDYGRAQALRITPSSNWGKIFVVRCGVDLSTFPARKDTSPTSKVFHILTVGRLAPEKGHQGLIQAFAVVLKSGIDAKLTIIGDGPLYQELSKNIIALNLQDLCVLAGQKTEEEVLKSLATTDLFVLSSFMEGLPVVLMEALGMRVVVIAPGVAGIPELVRHNESGLLFAPGNWNELAEQMEQSVRDHAMCKRMAEKGRQRVEKEFDIHLAVEPLVEHFMSDETIESESI